MMSSSRKNLFNFHNYNSLLKLTIIFLVFFISIGYSALNSSLMVTGDLVYRAKGDIRITGVRISGITNGGVEQYSPKYTKNTVSLGMKLPSLNSTVTYEVTIKNSSSNKYIISSITDNIVGNPNISYTHNYTDIIIGANSTIKVLLTYKYNSSETTLPSDMLKETTLSFGFEIAVTSLYERIKSDYENGKNVKLYTGDKSTFIGNKNVYYYYGETTNNNVIFAGFCWQMYRTTETGGVKMIYNGVPSSGQCTNKDIHDGPIIGSSAFNSNDSSLADVGYMYNKRYTSNFKSARSSYLYGNSFTYSGGTYTLTNTQSVVLDDSTVSSLTSKHYTCFNTTGSCTILSYVYLASGSDAYYINLTGGTSIEQALNEMLYNNNVNTTNSTIKTVIDSWYANNMLGYTSYLEDTIWCNDRSMNNQSANGWNPNGGSMTEWLSFKSYGDTTNLTCQNKNDRFTVSSTNGNGKLTYPIGLMTKQEQSLMYYLNNTPVQYNLYAYWMLSPSYYSDRSYNFLIKDYGDSYDIYATASSYLRPVISLRSGTEYTSGNGTKEKPFKILISSSNMETLYGKMKFDYENGGNVRLYTGDKSTFLGNESIYYYRGPTTNNNVLFADFCWKMYRTTETGGVKMIYNGLPDSNDQCTDDSGGGTIGDSEFNLNSDSLADVGYMYNKRYTYQSKSLSTEGEIVGPTIEKAQYNIISNDTTNTYTFDDSIKKWISNNHDHSTSSTLEFSIKKAGDYYFNYTITSEASYDKGTVYVDGVQKLQDSGSKTASIYLGSLTTSNVIKVVYSKDGSVSKDADNIVFSIGKTSGTVADNRWKYGNSFTYSGGTYTLTNVQSATLSSDYASLTSKHYTCWNTTGTCTTISYIYYATKSWAYYIDLTGGTSIEKALNEMLYDDNVNTTNSIIKTAIDTWYQNNMTGYTSYLEDIIWCNDRSMNNQSANGWNPNGGSMTTYLYFKSYGDTTNLTCQNKNDRFTVSSTNGNGKLTYPVGLVTRQEAELAYYTDYVASGSSTQNKSDYYTLSPFVVGNLLAYGNYVVWYSKGDYSIKLDSKKGVRPSISLRSGIKYLSGDGSSINPFVVET